MDFNRKNNNIIDGIEKWIYNHIYFKLLCKLGMYKYIAAQIVKIYTRLKCDDPKYIKHCHENINKKYKYVALSFNIAIYELKKDKQFYNDTHGETLMCRAYNISTIAEVQFVDPNIILYFHTENPKRYFSWSWVIKHYFYYADFNYYNDNEYSRTRFTRLYWDKERYEKLKVIKNKYPKIFSTCIYTCDFINIEELAEEDPEYLDKLEKLPIEQIREKRGKIIEYY